MPLDHAHCPADLEEIAEAFAMDTLPEGDAEAFSEHLLICAKCRVAVEAADIYVRAVSEAAARLRGEGE